jgi:hypothetical protein
MWCATLTAASLRNSSIGCAQGVEGTAAGQNRSFPGSTLSTTAIAAPAETTSNPISNREAIFRKATSHRLR